MNINSNLPLDIEKEKKKNTKLAIGVASIGVFSFFGLYVIMFAVMFLSPGLLFSMMPFPSLSKDIVSINNKLYVISKEIDMSSISFENTKQPEERFLIGALENAKILNPKEIKHFNSFTGDGNKIYFLDNGLYRTFDGENLSETKTNVIGENPKGATGPDGLFVLSEIKNSPVLNLIKGDETLSIPLPEEFSGDKQKYFCSSQLLWFQENLYLFWSSGDVRYWAVYDGKGWTSAELSDDKGTIKVISDDKRIYLFNERFSDQQQGIILTAFENGSWSEAKELDVHGMFLGWQPVIHQGKLLLYVRSFFSENLYAIENGKAVNPVRIDKSFLESGFILKGIELAVVSNFVFFFFIYLLSIFIGKFKLRTWRLNSSEYEFASLFRRFSAHFIDTIIIMLPPAIIFAMYFLNGLTPQINPLKIIFMVFLAVGYLFIGSFLYHSLLEGLYGKTIGKKLCGIVVLKDDFSKCNLLAGFLRNLMRIVDSFFYYLVAVVTMTGTLKWQRLGDIVAGTVVVRERKT